LGFYIRNKYNPENDSSPFKYSGRNLTTNINYSFDARIQPTCQFMLKMKPILNSNQSILFLLVFTCSNKLGVIRDIGTIELKIVSGSTLDNIILKSKNVINPPLYNPLHMQQAYEVLQTQYTNLHYEHALLQEQYQLLLNNYTENNAAFEVMSQILGSVQNMAQPVQKLITRGGAPSSLINLEIVDPDRIRITFFRFVDSKWIDCNAKDTKGTITEASEHLYYEHNDKIRIKITNSNSFNVNFVVHKKAHGETQFKKVYPISKNSQVLPAYLTYDSKVPSDVDISLPNCQLPSTLSINEVPAVDTYLIAVWAGVTGQDSIVKIIRKVHIYNEHQSQLELIKDNELEEIPHIGNESNSGQVDTDKFQSLTVTNTPTTTTISSVDLKEQDNIEKIKAMGFSNESLILDKLRENEGNIEKTVRDLVDMESQ